MHAAGLSAEHIVRVPLKFMVVPSILRGTPGSYDNNSHDLCNDRLKFSGIEHTECINSIPILTLSNFVIASMNGFKISSIPYLSMIVVRTTATSCMLRRVERNLGRMFPIE